MAFWELKNSVDLYASFDGNTTGLDVVTGTPAYTAMPNGRQAINTGSAQIRKQNFNIAGGKLTLAWRGYMTGGSFPEAIYAKPGVYDGATGAHAQLGQNNKLIARGSSANARQTQLDALATTFGSYVVVYDGTTCSIYRNGALTASTGSIDAVAGYVGNIFLASTYNGVTAAGAFVQDAIVDNKAWTAEQIIDFSGGLEPTNITAPTISVDGPCIICSPGTWNGYSNGTVSYAYQWYKNGEILPGAASPFLPWRLYGGLGTYQCKVRAINDGGYWELQDTYSNTVSILQDLDTRLVTELCNETLLSNDWTSKDSSWTISNGQARLDIGNTAGKLLTKSMSTKGLRVAVSFDSSAITSTGLFSICSIKAGSTVLAKIATFNSLGTRYVRMQVFDDYCGAGTNFNTTTGSIDIAYNGLAKIEIALDPVRKSAYFWFNGAYRGSYYNCAGSPATITSIEFGESEGTGTGTLVLDNIIVDTDYTLAINPELVKIWDLVLAAGQSNMAGAVTTGWETDVDYPGVWYVAPADSIGTFTENATYSGPRIFSTFIKNTDLSTDGTPLVIHGGFGGTGFEGGSPMWSYGALRRTQVRDTLVSILSAPANKYPYYARAKAIIWHQGESDTTLSSAAYLSYLIDIVKEWRTYTGGVPFICGGLSPDEYPSIPNSELAQAVASEIIPNSTFVSSRTPVGATTKVGETVHFDGPGLRTMGARYANSYYELTTKYNKAISTSAYVFKLGPFVTSNA